MATSAMPSPSTVALWNNDAAPGTFGQLLDWCRIAGPLRAGLLAALDADEGELIRALTLLGEEVANGVIAGIKINEAAPGPLQLAKLHLFFAAAWHTARGGDGEAKKEPAAATTVGTSGALSLDMPDVVALNGVVTQVGTTLVKLMPQAEYDALFPLYVKACGAPMAEDSEPTRVQMSAYKANIRDKDTLYVDLAVWGPNADRSEKLRAMEGVRLDGNGRLVPLVLYGPPDAKTWLKRYKSWRNSTIMLEHISPEMLDRYPDRVMHFADTYPDYLWPLLYQADVRARSDHLNRLARKAREEKRAAEEEGSRHPYNREKPWEYPWRQLVLHSSDFWEREFKEPAHAVRMKWKELHEELDGDAPVASSLPASSLTTGTCVPTSTAQKTATNIPPVPDATHERPARAKRPALAIMDAAPCAEEWLLGWRRSNNQGTSLCCGFQHGTCTSAVKSRCSKDGKKAHQCAICLDNRHGAKACDKKKPEDAKAKRRRRK